MAEKLHPCVEALEELISECLPGWSEGSAEAIQDQFKWEHFRNGAAAILARHKAENCTLAETSGEKFNKALKDEDCIDEEPEPTDDEILGKDTKEE